MTVIAVTHLLAKIYFSLITVLNEKKNLALTFLYYLGQRT